MKIVIPSKKISVSHISTLMRVIQVSMRETAAREVTGDPDSFPVLYCETGIEDSSGNVVFGFTFFEKETGSRMDEYTNQVSESLVEDLIRYINGNSQASLWGFSIVDKNTSSGDIHNRMEQLRRELNRYKGSFIEHAGKIVTFDGESFSVGA